MTDMVGCGKQSIAETDVNVIREQIGECLDRARVIRTKAWGLHQDQEPEKQSEPMPTASTIGEEFKDSTRLLRNILSEALDTLQKFC